MLMLMLMLLRNHLGRVLVATTYLAMPRTLKAAIFRVERGSIRRWLYHKRNERRKESSIGGKACSRTYSHCETE